MADTKRQEQASLVTFYYAIEKGANLGTLQEPAIGAVDRDEDLYNAMSTAINEITNEYEK